MQRFFPVLCALASLALLTACLNRDLPGLTGVAVTLTGIERGADGLARVHWQISNPNVVSYLIENSRHKVYLDGSYVGTVAWREPVGLNRQSAQPQSAVIQMEKNGEAVLAAALARGSAGYRIESVLTINAYGNHRESFHTEAAGTVPLAEK